VKSQETEALDALVAQLEARVGRSAGSPDAIDATLAGRQRVSEVTRVADRQEMQQFRRALQDGMVQADTVNRALRLVNHLLQEVL
jgi:hypothetical protein